MSEIIAEREQQRAPDGSPVFDTLDIDLLVKVLSHTVFSPFFVFFIPVFYVFQGVELTNPMIVGPAIYYVVLSLAWFTKWYSRLYRNQGSLLYGPGRFDWGEQIVLVTGGASGVGELLANTLAVRNVNIVVLDVNPIVTENYNISYYKCDVSNWEEVEAVSKKIIEEIGHPTVLVNNAGVVQGKRILDLSPEDIKQTFGVNTLAHFWTLKAFLPGMIERKAGHIITMSSNMGIAGVAQMTDYCASKAALISLNESLRYELDQQYKCPNIRTSLFIPGHLLTPLFSNVTFPAIQKFFMPPVAPVTVVKKIIAVMDEQHSQTIMMPFYSNFMPLLPLLPSFVTDTLRSLTGSDHAMENFVKISGRRPDEGPAPTTNGVKRG